MDGYVLGRWAGGSGKVITLITFSNSVLLEVHLELCGLVILKRPVSKASAIHCMRIFPRTRIGAPSNDLNELQSRKAILPLPIEGGFQKAQE